MDEKIDFKFSKEDVSFLLSPEAIREKARAIYNAALDGRTNFIINEDKFEEVADFVLETIKENYPEMDIPYHSRWGHFNTSGKKRTEEIFARLSQLDQMDKSIREVDLVIVSVLLDAGAGDTWSYFDKSTGEKIARSEGLAVASYEMFCAGAFSLNANDPLRVDAQRLVELTVEDLEEGFQVSKDNPLEGVEGRVSLLNALGKTILKNQTYFKEARPGSIVSYLHSISIEDKIEAGEVLKTILLSLGSIWPGRVKLGGKNLGDVWSYKPFVKGEGVECLIPFHKLSQWLTYSLIESVERSGVKVLHLDQLTGLAEYRNGGLFIDLEVYKLKDDSEKSKGHHPEEDLIIEWRALTIIGLDTVASIIRKKLKITSVDFPLPKILEGGTWHAGRKIARQLRPSGAPPLKIISDGTVF